VLPKPPRLLVVLGELVVPDVPLDDGERPTTVGVEVVPGPLVDVGVRGAVLVDVSRVPPPHHQPPPLEREPPPPEVPLDVELERELPHRSGCHSLVCGFGRHVAPACRTWQASIVG
jgi:hypothetical protein